MNLSSAGGATIVNNGGSTVFRDSSTAGNASIMNANNGISIFVNRSSAENASITNNGGVVQFFNSSSAANSVVSISNGGVAQFLDNSTAGNASLTNSGGYVEFFDQTNTGNSTLITNKGGYTLFFGSSSAGQARANTGAGGVFDLSSLATTGMTVGSIEGEGTYFLGSRTLTVGGNNLSTTVGGILTDGGWSGGSGGSLVKQGLGTLTLSGANTYTGSTTVLEGTLDITGSIASSSLTTVANGGTLGGTGVVGNTQIGIGGVLAPGTTGAATGSLNIAGSLAFQSGAIYLVQISPTDATSATVTGSAALTGTVDAQFAPGRYMAKRYTILTAIGGLGGTTFTGLTDVNLPQGVSASLSYDANDVYLNLRPGFTTYTGLSGGQQKLAGALTNYFNGTGGIPATFFGLAPSGLTQVGGEAATGAERGTFQLMNEFLGLMLDPFVDGRGGDVGGGQPMQLASDAQASLPPDVALAYVRALKASPSQTFDQRWGVWGKAYGGSNTASGNAALGTSNVTASTYGFASGLDYRVAPNTVVGFALAGGGTNWGLAQGLGGGRGEAFQAGIYGITHAGPAYLSTALAFANNWMTTNRAALGDQLVAKFAGQSYGARIEAGYRYAASPTVGVTPYAALQGQSFHRPNYGETDLTGGGFGLSYSAKNVTDVRTELGARFDIPTLVGGMPLALRGRLAWAHDFVNNPSLSAEFQALPGASFTVNGAAIPRDSALVSAGAELLVTSHLTALAKFDGEFASNSKTYAGTGTLRYTW